MPSVAPREFVAFTECPHCDALGFHDLDLPPDVDPLFVDRPGADSFTNLVEDPDRITGWDVSPVRIIHHVAETVWRVDRSTCDCIRTCSQCGAQWGEK